MNYSFPYKAHFERKALVYVSLIAILTAGYVFAVKSRSALRKYQKFNLFVATRLVDSDALRSKIKPIIDSETVKEVVINNCDPSLSSYYTMYSTFGLEDADILILCESNITLNDLSARFLPIKDSYAGYDSTNFINGDAHYGIRAFDGENGYLSDEIQYEEGKSYYIFINKKSQHLLGYQDEGKTYSVSLFLGGLLS